MSIIEALNPLAAGFGMIAAIRRALRAAAARSPAVFFARTSSAAADAEIIGAPPSAASNIRLKVEKLANVGEPNVEFSASMSAEVPAGLNGASVNDSPPQPARVTLTSATVTTDRFANCSTRMGSASIIREQLRAARG